MFILYQSYTTKKLANLDCSLRRVTNKRSFSGYLQNRAHLGIDKRRFSGYSKNGTPLKKAFFT
ncbi:hypothetical protein QE429_004836 [Bacillus sp. SORGH_AS 510]|nr:hypothetical protein [Bacillus sp. SORGH_AS_0510]